MSTTTIYKLFWADQDLEQEQWLREKARQGLHLRKLNLFCGWTFEQGAPADVVYRVDFNERGNQADYRQLFHDAGWQLAAELTGWLYWRKPVVDGRAPEILTDSASKIARFQQVLRLAGLAMSPLLLMLITSNAQRTLDNVSEHLRYGVLTVAALGIPLYAYMALRLFRRIRQLRNTPL
jgi:hypothetical protein